MSYGGSCHCGAVKFVVNAEVPKEAMSCNCSHCRRKGFLLSFVPAQALSVVKGEHTLKDYFFNKHKIAHRFCNICGCQPFSLGVDASGNAMASINLRCVPSIDLDGLSIQKIDGASF